MPQAFSPVFFALGSWGGRLHLRGTCPGLSTRIAELEAPQRRRGGLREPPPVPPTPGASVLTPASRDQSPRSRGRGPNHVTLAPGRDQPRSCDIHSAKGRSSPYPAQRGCRVNGSTDIQTVGLSVATRGRQKSPAPGPPSSPGQTCCQVERQESIAQCPYGPQPLDLCRQALRFHHFPLAPVPPFHAVDNQ